MVETRRPMRGRLILTLVLALIIVITAGIWFFANQLARVAIPSGTPSGELTFVSNRDGTWDVWALDQDGTLRNLTGGDAFHDYFSSWDFASERINFLSARMSDEMGPAQVLPEGGEVRALSIFDAVTTMFFEGRTDWDPAWSPGGDQVAWASLRDLNLELYVADTDSIDAFTRLTNGGARDWFPAWSPDGAQLAFASDRAGSEDVYIMDIDGSNIVNLTDNPADDVMPVWSLDGETILFVSERDGLLGAGNLNLYLTDPAGGEITTLAEDALFEGDPTWTADGAEYVYMSNRDGNWSLYLTDATGENTRRLTDDAGDDLFPVWRPVPATLDE